MEISDFMGKKKVSEFFQQEGERVRRYLCSRFGVSDDDAEDAFAEGCHALLDAIQSGRFSSEYHENSLSCYLQNCCRNQLLKMLRNRKKEIPTDLEGRETDGGAPWDDEGGNASADGGMGTGALFSSDYEESQQHEIDLQLMESILEDLPYPCKDLIWGKYKEHFSATEMSMRLGYKSSRVAITTLNRCMQKLKNRFNSERRMTNG